MEPQIQNALKIVLCDKSPLVLAGLVQLFEAGPRFEIVATVADGKQFMDVAESRSFEIGVIGWQMPFMGGRDILARLRGAGSGLKIVIYTGEPTSSTPRQAMLEGAAGFCAKKEPPERLVETVVSVGAGRMVFPFMDMRNSFVDPLESLSVREAELLRALSEGMTNADVANQLKISVNTVKFHLKNLYEKLNVRNRAQAVARYLNG